MPHTPHTGKTSGVVANLSPELFPRLEVVPMAARKPLRAVSADEKAPPAQKPKTVTQAAEKGTQRELLLAMKARVAEAVENPNTPARDLAALTKRLLEIAREIDAIDARADEEATENAVTADEAWDAQAL